MAVSNNFLIGRFAEFYEEVVRIKLATHDGRLQVYLADADQAPNVSGAQLAAMVSSRLYGRLMQQARAVRASSGDAEIRAYAMVQFVMAALADEIFILELDWPGREAWLNHLLENALFRTNSAGRNFFLHVDQLLAAQAPGRLHIDLATIFLIALQLGFKGQYRGKHGEAMLKEYRDKLWRFVNSRRRASMEARAFPEAYEHLIAEQKDLRIAPLSGWYMAGGICVLLYLLASTLLWVGMLHDEFQINGKPRVSDIGKR